MDKFIIISISVRLRRFKAIFLLAHLLKFISYGHCCGILCATTLKSAAYDACFPAKLLTGLESCNHIGCVACTDSQYDGKILIQLVVQKTNAAGLRIKSHSAE